jgi:hypothetical protein
MPSVVGERSRLPRPNDMCRIASRDFAHAVKRRRRTAGAKALGTKALARSAPSAPALMRLCPPTIGRINSAA